MDKRNVWVVEEVKLEDGSIAQRQSTLGFSVNEDGTWHWNCPVERLSENGQKEWSRIMDVFQNINGEDLRHLVCGVALMDHCFNPAECEKYTN